MLKDGVQISQSLGQMNINKKNTMINESVKSKVQSVKIQIEKALANSLPNENTWPVKLHKAQRHALLSPGKRFRPLLCCFVASGLGKEDEAVILVGCVAEMVHAASLILDDLPCMDDADIRRNQPSTHIEFDESTAILSATALLNQAFSVISKLNNVTDKTKVMLVDLLSHTVGSNGLIAGQIADLSNNSSATTLKDVEDLNTLKTGALFDFSIESAAILSNASEVKKKHLKEFSRYLGLAFQLMDDVKDKLMSQEIAEKSINRDIGKATILAIKGSSLSMEILTNYLKKSKESLIMADLSNLNAFDVLFESQFSFLKTYQKIK